MVDEIPETEQVFSEITQLQAFVRKHATTHENLSHKAVGGHYPSYGKEGVHIPAIHRDFQVLYRHLLKQNPKQRPPRLFDAGSGFGIVCAAAAAIAGFDAWGVEVQEPVHDISLQYKKPA